MRDDYTGPYGVRSASSNTAMAPATTADTTFRANEDSHWRSSGAEGPAHGRALVEEYQRLPLYTAKTCPVTMRAIRQAVMAAPSRPGVGRSARAWACLAQRGYLADAPRRAGRRTCTATGMEGILGAFEGR